MQQPGLNKYNQLVEDYGYTLHADGYPGNYSFSIGGPHTKFSGFDGVSVSICFEKNIFITYVNSDGGGMHSVFHPLNVHNLEEHILKVRKEILNG